MNQNMKPKVPLVKFLKPKVN